jgi:NarL family two-component system response regulator LiaR
MNDEKAKPIRILIADDHTMVREGLRAFIAARPNLTLVGEATNGLEAIAEARLKQPDIILLDLVMPEADGVQAIQQIKTENPNARILVLTSFSEDDKVFPAIKAGALGYLLKDSSPQELSQAINDVYQGKPSLHPTIALKVMRELNQPSNLPPTKEPLTHREAEVLRLVARGLTNSQIAEDLSISEMTVGTHISNLLGKLHLANRTQAALYALREGMASLWED